MGKPPTGMMSVHIYSGDTMILSPNGALNSRRILVTATPQQIVSQLSDRQIMRVMVLGDDDVYLNANSSVSSGDGWPVFSNTWQDFKIGSGIQPYIMQSSGTGDCRIMDIN